MTTAIRRPVVSASTALLVVLLAVAMLTGCAPKRSVAAFCGVIKDQSLQLHAKYMKADQNAQSQTFGGELSALGTMLGTEGDMELMFRKLDQVAPDDIEPDVAQLLDAFEKAQDAAGGSFSNPLGAIGGSLVAGLSSMGAEHDVETYVNQNCDLSWMKTAP